MLIITVLMIIANLGQHDYFHSQTEAEIRESYDLGMIKKVCLTKVCNVSIAMETLQTLVNALSRLQMDSRAVEEARTRANTMTGVRLQDF